MCDVHVELYNPCPPLGQPFPSLLLCLSQTLGIHEHLNRTDYLRRKPTVRPSRRLYDDGENDHVAFPMHLTFPALPAEHCPFQYLPNTAVSNREHTLYLTVSARSLPGREPGIS